MNTPPAERVVSGSLLDWGSAPTGLYHKAQGWPRFLRPTLEICGMIQPTLKGLSPDATLSGLK